MRPTCWLQKMSILHDIHRQHGTCVSSSLRFVVDDFDLVDAIQYKYSKPELPGPFRPRYTNSPNN